MRIRTCAVRLAVAAFFVVGMLAANASATTITLSDATSDAGTMLAIDMNATVDFSISGSTLTIDVTNTSTGTIQISELYFNSDASVSSITLTSTPTHSGSGDPLWVFATSVTPAGFGTFDYGLEGIKSGNGPSAEFGEILAGGSALFTFTVTGAGFDADSFAADVSSGGAFVAAKFHPNGNNQNAIGAAIVPEPSTAALMALGLIGLTQLGRRRS